MSEITAADREAMCAASTQSLAPNILRGDWDDTRIMRAFAKHRIQARNAALEEAARVAESDRLILSECRGPGTFGQARKDHGELIASQIRTLTTTTTKGDE